MDELFETLSSFSEDEEDSEYEDDLEDFALLLLIRSRMRRRKNRNIWTHAVRTEKHRKQCGVYHTLLPKLTDEQFKHYLRTTRTEFEEIHDYIKDDLKKQDTRFRLAISSKHRLAICLRFLASGETFRSLSFHFRLGESTVSIIVKEVCDAIWHRMANEYLPILSVKDWEDKAAEFKMRWRFPNCLSSIDGKHITIKKPTRSGSEYYNYKKSFSIVLLAGVDANYKFTFIDVGVKGRFSDGYTFAQSNFGKRLISNQLNIPSPTKIEPGGDEMPFVFVADAAFPLSENLMRPYPGTSTKSDIPNRIFNYRLSHARQTVECAFGILSARFRIYQRPLEFEPRSVEAFVKSTCVLHNYLRTKSISFEHELEEIPNVDFEDPHNQLIDVPSTKARSARKAYLIREKLKNYFINVDPIPYQEQAVRNGKY
ncbi:uncharacterized protein LOC135843983 [Planococcus citri]|uniref:uncharacterized protein LOC135831441 n=1 Tax=Planococcus citri TaxID=170843 RepID=UPI0031F76C2F